MKAFFERYSFYSFKMFIDQIALALFGLVLALATAKSGVLALQLICGFGSVIFYLFLLYLVGWEAGSKDRITCDLGKMKYRPVTGLLISLLANSLNILLAVFALLGFVADLTVLGQIGTIGSLYIEGMYTGLLKFNLGEHPLNSYWFMYFVIILPSLAVGTVSYILGYHNIMFTGIMKMQYPASDRPEKKKKDK